MGVTNTLSQKHSNVLIIKNPTKKVFGHLLKGILAASIGNMLQWKQKRKILNDHLSEHISYWQAWSDKMYALNLLRGPMKKAFKDYVYIVTNWRR